MLPSEQKIQATFQSAPQYVQDFILSDELNDAFEELREKYALHIDEAGKISLAINAIALNLAPIASFPKLIAEALPGKPEDMRNDIANDVNTHVFASLRESAQQGAPAPEESVPQPTPLQRKITDTKLSNTVSGRAEDVPLGGAEAPQVSKNDYKGTDPYREPID
jgi:hypothetical protein